MKKREHWLDIIKAICVMVIVFYHAGADVLFFKWFFVAIFYIGAGYVFLHKPFKLFINRQLKSLWIPFVISNTIIILSHNILAHLNLFSNYYSGIEILKGIYNTLLFNVWDSLGAPSWFIVSLFFSNLLFYTLFVISKKINEKNNNFILGTLCTILGIFALYFTPYLNKVVYGNCSLITVVLVSQLFAYVGYMIKKLNLVDKFLSGKIINQILIFISSGFVMIFLYKNINFSIDFRSFFITSKLYTFFIPILAFVLLSSFAKFIEERFKLLKSILCFIGTKTLYLVLYHGLAFQVVTYIQVNIKKIPLGSDWGWKNVYIWDDGVIPVLCIVGVLIPIEIKCIVDVIKDINKKKRIKN